jgi:hypothetical protein
MKASDLLGSSVYTYNGIRVGRLFDIEARQIGPLVSEAWGNALQVSGLLVGSLALLLRLGYHQKMMRGPIGLRFLARRSKGYRVRWDQLAAISDGSVLLNCSIEELERLSPPT